MESGVNARARGVAMETCDNTDGAAAAKLVRGLAGTYTFHSLADHVPTKADVGQLVYAYDNHTVSRDNVDGLMPVMGRLMQVFSDGRCAVHVGVDIDAGESLDGLFSLEFRGVSANAADAAVERWVVPFPCRIEKVFTVLQLGALATGNALVQVQKNGADVGTTTTGLVTITQAGSAAGDVDSCTPATANLELDEGDVLSFVIEGTATGDRALNISARLRAI